MVEASSKHQGERKSRRIHASRNLKKLLIGKAVRD
jgi:hypothetical protein